MTRRLLPVEEWPRLEGTELGTVWPHLRDGLDTVLVVEDDGAIVACWASVMVRHLEGVWIAESHRGKAAVARHLLCGMRNFVGGGGRCGPRRSAMTCAAFWTVCTRRRCRGIITS